MIAARWLPADVRKELRALMPVWATMMGTLIVVAVIDLLDARFDHRAAAHLVGGFLLNGGSIGLGTSVFGHEFVFGTMPALLLQPRSRRRMFVVKFGVLAVLLLVVNVVAAIEARLAPQIPGTIVRGFGWSPLAFLCGLLVAPFMSLMTRDEVKAAVLAFLVPITLLILGFAMSANAPHVFVAYSPVGTWTICAICPFLAWKLFKELEVSDSTRRPFIAAGRAALTRVSSVSRHHPVTLLVLKELRFQRPTLLIAGIYAALGLLVPVLAQVEFRSRAGLQVDSTASVFLVVVAIMAGALGSAEERRLGTLESQLLLPIAAGRQWLIKVVVVVGLGVAIGVGLPALLAAFVGQQTDLRFQSWFGEWRYAVVIVLSTLVLYVSSLSTSGFRAMLASVPFLLGVSFAYAPAFFFARWVSNSVYSMIRRSVPGFSDGTAIAVYDITVALLFLFAIGVVVLVLKLAFENHRRADRSIGRVWLQAVWATGCVALALSIASTAEAYYHAGTGSSVFESITSAKRAP